MALHFHFSRNASTEQSFVMAFLLSVIDELSMEESNLMEDGDK